MPSETTNLEKLIAALRSGKYEQCFGAMRRDNGFCPLGVACDISGLGGWKYANNGSYKYYVGTYAGASSFPPPDVSRWFDMDQSLEEAMLTQNDGLRLPFTAIADFLEDVVRRRRNNAK